jgi:hypothetical protein
LTPKKAARATVFSSKFMSSYWSKVCTEAQSRPLKGLLTDLYVSGGVLVRRAREHSLTTLVFFFAPQTPSA